MVIVTTDDLKAAIHESYKRLTDQTKCFLVAGTAYSMRLAISIDAVLRY